MTMKLLKKQLRPADSLRKQIFLFYEALGSARL